jgi:hypothetical protein
MARGTKVSTNSLREAIIEGFRKAGWMSPAEDVVYQIEYCVNQMEGRAANEGEKKERRKTAVEKLDAIKFSHVADTDFMKEADAIVEEAQG